MELRYLNKDEYPVWDAFIDISPQGSILSKSWWLEAVGGDVRVLGAFDKDRLVAGMPLYFKNKLFFTLCTMPKLTVGWGVALEPMKAKRVEVISREMEILEYFADYLLRYKFFIQYCSPELQNWLPFYWAGFKQTTRFTYVLDNLKNTDELWAGLRGNIRTYIRKAEKKGIAVEPCSPETALELFQKTFTRQDRKLSYSRDYFLRLYNAAKAHNAGECFAALDPEGRPHAAVFLVWDLKRAYYLISGGDPELRNSGATSLLTWKLIQFASKKSAVFDFEGSMIKPIERFFRDFGGRPVPYSAIVKFPLPARLFLALRGNA